MNGEAGFYSRGAVEVKIPRRAGNRLVVR